MEKLNIALLAGGDSSERSVSLQSAVQVAEAFNREKYIVMVVDVRGNDWEATDDAGNKYRVDLTGFSARVNDSVVKFDYAFIMIHGTPGEDGKLQGYLDIVGVPYSSCGFVSSVITFDKTLCKRTVSGIGGLYLARQKRIYAGEPFDADNIINELGLPLFVKPNASGSSCGVTKVKTADGLAPAIKTAFDEGSSVLIEEFIDGREFGCGLSITKEREYLLPVTEIISKNDFFDYKAKYTAGKSDEITPADINAELSAELQRLAAKIYRSCECRGLVRIDFIVTADNQPYMVE